MPYGLALRIAGRIELREDRRCVCRREGSKPASREQMQQSRFRQGGSEDNLVGSTLDWTCMIQSKLAENECQRATAWERSVGEVVR